MMRLPNYDLKMEISEFLLKGLVQSKGSRERILFLDLAAIASEEFSQEYFNRHFAHLVFFY